MKKRRYFSLFVIAAILSGVCDGAMFMSLYGIPGDSTDPNHTGWIDVEGFSHEIVWEGGIAAKHGALIVTFIMDKSAPLLNLYACNQNVINSLYFNVTSDADTSKLHYTIELTNAHVEGVTTAGNDTQPMRVTVFFRYSSIFWTYYSYDAGGNPAGTVQAGWNVLSNSYYH